MRVSTTYVKCLLTRFEATGLNSNELLISSGINEKQLFSDRWIRIEKMIALWKKAVEKSLDPHFGVHVGEHLCLNALGIVGSIMQVSQTLETSLSKMIEFNELTCELFEYTKVHLTKSVALIRISVLPAIFDRQTERHLISAEIASLISFMRGLTGKKIIPEEVTFTFPSLNEYEAKNFECPIKYNSTENSLKISFEYLRLRLPGEDTDLREFLEQNAKKLLNESSTAEKYTEKSRRLLLRSLHDGRINSIELLAEKLNLSVRTLQRKLKDENTTYNTLLEEVIYSSALRHLETSTELTISEISYLLGYSDPCIFSRFFKRKSGFSPEDFRVRQNENLLEEPYVFG